MDKVRSSMTEFWKEHSKEATVEEMMLNSRAKELSEHEMPEILSLLPSLAGKRVLELAAGIGRYTNQLLAKADHVTAVDFMESFVEKNRQENSHHGNGTFIQADVTKLDFPKNSFDMIFSNWLLMYLSDEELTSLAEKMLSWLTPGGFFFFRESCNHHSGDCKRDWDPSQYRTQAQYSSLITSAQWEEPEGPEKFGFDIVLTKTVQTYIKMMNHDNQNCWLLKKASRSSTTNGDFTTRARQ